MLFSHDNGNLVYGTPKAMGLQLAALDTAELVELTLLPDGNIPAHSLDIPVTFYVVCGEGVACIDGTPCPVSTGDVITSSPGSTRELTNTGSSDFKVLVIKGC